VDTVLLDISFCCAVAFSADNKYSVFGFGYITIYITTAAFDSAAAATCATDP